MKYGYLPNPSQRVLAPRQFVGEGLFLRALGL